MMPGSAALLALAVLFLGTPALAQTLQPYKPTYTSAAPSNTGSGALLQKYSDLQTEGCNSNYHLLLHGTGSISRVDIWFHAKGGGYSGCVKLTPAGSVQSVNLAAERYGQGWQWSTRANTGAHNPTQAGTTQWLGTVVDIVQEANRIDVLKNQVPLFQNQEFDFVQKETWWADDFPGDDGIIGGSDGDGFSELSQWGSAWTSGDEVMSEFTTESRYRRVLTSNGIPAYSHQFYMAYEFPPKSLRQFTVLGVPDNEGKLIYRPDDLPKHISASRSGASSAVTYNKMVNSFGFRVDNSPGYDYQYYVYEEGGALRIAPIPGSSEERLRTYARILKTLDAPESDQLHLTQDDRELRQSEAGWPQIAGAALMIVSNEPALNQGKGIGLYVPRTDSNKLSVVKYDRSVGQVVGTENRRIQSMFLVVRDGTETATQTNLVYRHVLSGLFPPDHDGQSITELVYVDVIVLFGTPLEIFQAVQAMEAQ